MSLPFISTLAYYLHARLVANISGLLQRAPLWLNTVSIVKIRLRQKLLAISILTIRRYIIFPYVTIPNVTFPNVTIPNIRNNPEGEGERD